MPAAVVEAPSGYGKTTAIRDFLQNVVPQGTPVYWFTAVDESPLAGFRRLCGAINKVDNHAGERLLRIGLPNSANVGEACDALRSVECSQETYLVPGGRPFSGGRAVEILPPWPVNYVNCNYIVKQFSILY